VALFASSFHPHPGGVEELVRQLAHAQVEAGLEPTIITMRWPKSLPGHETFEGLDVHRLVFRTPERPARRLAAALVLGPMALAQLLWILRRRRAQVLHIQCVSPAAGYAVAAARILGLPLVATLQGELTMDATGLYQRSAWARRTLRLVLDRAAVITACSAHTLAEAEEWYGRPFGLRAEVVHNGVAPEDFTHVEPFIHDPPYLLAIGRHVPQKGFDVLIDAFARLAGQPGFDHDLLLAGDGSERPTLEAQVERLGLGEQVRFLGATDRATTAGLFRGAALFVLPSRHEPFGIVVLEALAAGTPVVACDVGGVGEFLPTGPSTRLTAPDDPGAMAEAIAAVLRDRADHPDEAIDAADTLRTHTWAAIEEAYAGVYRTAVTIDR
jgi:glycogen synthase